MQFRLCMNEVYTYELNQFIFLYIYRRQTETNKKLNGEQTYIKCNVSTDSNRTQQMFVLVATSFGNFIY